MACWWDRATKLMCVKRDCGAKPPERERESQSWLATQESQREREKEILLKGL